MVVWLKPRDYNQHGLGSNPTRFILLCPWERYFTAFFPACWSWQAVLNQISYLNKFQAAAISWYLRKQVVVSANQKDKYRDEINKSINNFNETFLGIKSKDFIISFIVESFDQL